MVGVFLGRPKSCQTGIVVMRDAQDTLLALGSLENVVVTHNDASFTRMKATWRGSRFTLTLTGNTGYVFLQGPSASLLAFGSHVANAIGGVLHTAKNVGAEPHNPDARGGAPGMTEPVAADNGPWVAEPVAEPGPESEQQQQQQHHHHHPTGARSAVVTSANEGAVASASEGASSSVLSGEGNVMLNVTFNDNTDTPAQVEGLANMLRNFLHIARRGSGQHGA